MNKSINNSDQVQTKNQNLANNLEVGGQFPQEADQSTNAFVQQHKLNLSLNNMNALFSGIYMNNEGIAGSNFGTVNDPTRANMDYNMTDNLNFMNLQSRIFDMHNIMKSLNLEGEQCNDN